MTNVYDKAKTMFLRQSATNYFFITDHLEIMNAFVNMYLQMKSMLTCSYCCIWSVVISSVHEDGNVNSSFFWVKIVPIMPRLKMGWFFWSKYLCAVCFFLSFYHSGIYRITPTLILFQIFLFKYKIGKSFI